MKLSQDTKQHVPVGGIVLLLLNAWFAVESAFRSFPILGTFITMGSIPSSHFQFFIFGLLWTGGAILAMVGLLKLYLRYTSQRRTTDAEPCSRSLFTFGI